MKKPWLWQLSKNGGTELLLFRPSGKVLLKLLLERLPEACWREEGTRRILSVNVLVPHPSSVGWHSLCGLSPATRSSSGLAWAGPLLASWDAPVLELSNDEGLRGLEIRLRAWLERR